VCVCVCVTACLCVLYTFRNSMYMRGNVFFVLAVTKITWLEYCGNNNETVTDL
jgi:hypothetical protein